MIILIVIIMYTHVFYVQILGITVVFPQQHASLPPESSLQHCPGAWEVTAAPVMLVGFYIPHEYYSEANFS